ncbi:APO protein 3 [Citrus sinensis]|uniref:APO protein 3 n=1 Tax=Citrus sinensis TaxID=2711 RepID=A0ACB8LA24_CITSI|nr:APO protein 3 [Citrus sinensis]
MYRKRRFKNLVQKPGIDIWKRMQRRILSQISQSAKLNFRFTQNFFLFSSNETQSPNLNGGGDDPLYSDVPKPRRDKSERKPYPTPMKVLIRRAKEERESRKAEPVKLLEHPPGNGLLVPELVSVAHQVYRARLSLLYGLSKLIQFIPVQRCRFCSEVHIGHVGHEIRTCTGPKSGFRSATHVWRKGGVGDAVFFPKCFHLHDRVGKARVVHDERHSVPRIPAIVELCIQAGVDIEKYPTKRRTKPVYSVSIRTLASWFEMISGAKEMMEKYTVWTCGYCPEVQVGPKGHKVRMCKASKHQSRDGMHAWQEATMDDLVGPNYVWHVQDLNGPALENTLKRYYGKAPAVVELCVHGGAPVPDQYRSMMRLDVVPPERDEVDLVA